MGWRSTLFPSVSRSIRRPLPALSAVTISAIRKIIADLFASTSAVVHPQFATIDLLLLKYFEAVHGAVHINEVCMCETSGLASAAVDGDSNVNDISNIAEELVEVGIGHLECEVTDEKGLGGWVWFMVALGDCLVVYHKATPFEDGLVLCLNGSGRFADGGKFNISKAACTVVSCDRQEIEVQGNLPFAQTSSVSSNEGLLDNTVLRKLPLKIGSSDVEEKVSDIDVRGGSQLRRFTE